VRAIFFDGAGQLRNGWWCLLFYLVLATFVLPLVIAGRALQVEVTVSAQAIAVLGATVVCQLVRREPLTVITGRLDRRWLREVALGGLAGLGLMAAPAAFLLLGGWVSFSRNALVPTELAAAALDSVTVAVAEELLFRGFVFQRLIAGLGAWPAQVLLAAYFVLTHSSNPNLTGSAGTLALLNIFVASILFGVAFLRTRSLAMPLALHGAANWVQGPLLGFGVSGHEQQGVWSPRSSGAPEWLTGGPVGLEGSLPGLACVLLLTVLLLRWRPRHSPSAAS
jgi:membrane protease YdiL (CAAX protease family)